MTDEDRALIAREFPTFDLASLPDIPDGFICNAWHNDTCPLWYERATPEPGDIMLGIDFPDHGGEFPESDRFSINLTERNYSEDVLFTSNDWTTIETLIRYVRRVRELGLGFHPDTRGSDYTDAQGRLFFSDDDASAHDELVEAVCGITDPYEIAFAVWRAQGLTD